MSGSKVMAFAKGFHMTYTLEHDTKSIFKKLISFFVVIDSQFIFDVHTKATYTTEEWLMIVLQTVKNAYKSFEASNVALNKSEFNIADYLTMSNTN